MKKLFDFLGSEWGRVVLGFVFFIPAVVTEQIGNTFFALALYILALLFAGTGVFIDAARGILRKDLLDEKFLMSVASIGAMIVGEWSEGVAVMLFFLVGEGFEHIAVCRSRSSIRALMDICPDEAAVLTENGEELVLAEEVAVGSRIIIRPGERVPIDCRIISGSTDVDTSSMTGESIPVSVGVGDTLDSGVVVIDGMIIAETLRLSGDSAAARVLEMVESASENKAREESFITSFSRIYTPIVVALALLLALIPPLFSLISWGEAVYRSLIFLVISCPCALVISVPMAFFGGIGGAASRGILFKGGNTFAPISRLDTVAFDKTGTLTSGKFAISKVTAFGVSEERVLYLAASAEYASNHPVALCIKASVTRAEVPREVEEIAGEGIIATLGEGTVAVGNSALMKRIGVDLEGITEASLYVAENGILLGSVLLSDEIKSEAAEAISALKALGVKNCVMISGDRRANAQKVSSKLSLDKVYFELDPAQKYEALEKLIASSDGGVMYVGDGINDAPALARADVGVAMGALGQDSAIEAADAVIMTDSLMKLPEAMLIARKTLRIAKGNIVFALSVKALILILGALGIANMWLAVFADVGVAVIAILNAMRALRAPKMKSADK